MDIVGIIAIIGFVVILCVEKYFHYKEKQDLIKMSRVKDVSDMEYVFGSEDDDLENNIDKESNLISLEEMTQEDLEKMRNK